MIDLITKIYKSDIAIKFDYKKLQSITINFIIYSNTYFGSKLVDPNSLYDLKLRSIGIVACTYFLLNLQPLRLI
jgi:hypothetical protein